MLAVFFLLPRMLYTAATNSIRATFSLMLNYFTFIIYKSLNMESFLCTSLNLVEGQARKSIDYKDEVFVMSTLLRFIILFGEIQFNMKRRENNLCSIDNSIIDYLSNWVVQPHVSANFNNNSHFTFRDYGQ